MIVLNLIQNIAILITLTVLHQIVLRRWKTDTLMYKLLSGIMFGGVGVVGMMTPVHYAPGIIFDGRSIILSVSGLFGGPVVAAVAAVICGAYRLSLGGAGALVGASVIMESAAIGIVFYYLRRRHAGLMKTMPLLGFGLLVHIVMLLLMLALPGGAGIEVLRRIALPVLLVYPPATMLICQIFIDNEKRTSAEKALMEGEARYRAMLNDAADAILIADTEGCILESNIKAEILLGYKKEELAGMNFRQLHPQEELERVTNAFKEMMEGVLNSCNDVRVLTKNGTSVSVDITGTAIEVAGKLLMQGIIRDITERKRAESALAESEERYRSLFENSIDAVLLTAPDGRILAANPAACSILGHSEEDICRLGREGIVDLTDPCLAPALEERARTGRFRGELRFVRSDGSVFPSEISTVIFTDQDRNLKTSMIIRDITERKRAEEELKEKNRELQSAHEQLKIKQAQIIQQEKMASIGQLAAGIAHEINNPTSFVYGNLDLLKKFVSGLTDTIREQDDLLKKLAPEETLQELQERRKKRKLDFIIQDIQRLIQQSLEGAERIKKIVKNLSRFSRSEQQEHSLEDINAGLERAIDIIWSEIRFDVELRKELGEIPRTMCDIAQLSQVFLNLLGNAAHAVGKGGLITVRTRADDANIYVSVADTGVGIAEENMGRIFDAFFTTKEVGRGTGLGLSISYEIVKKHKGEITVESKIGEGSTFTVRIPIVKS